MRTRLIHWLEAHQAACSWKSALGISCPGCGMQTALIELMKGHLTASLAAFPALIPMMVMMVLLALHLVFKFRNGASWLKFLFIFTAAIMFVHYILHLISH